MVRRISFRENTPPVVGKTAVLPCSDEPTKKTFEQAITGVLGKGTLNLTCPDPFEH